MNVAAAPPPRFIADILDRIARRSSIRRTLVAVLVLALAPLVLFAFVQGGIRVINERSDLKADLVAMALRAEATESANFNQIHDGLMLLAANAAVATNTSARCADLFEVATAVLPNISSIISMTDNGEAVCSSVRTTAGASSEIALAVPWKHGDRSGTLVGSVDLLAYQTSLSRRHATRAQTIAIVTQDGKIIAKSRDLPWQRLPAVSDDGAIVKAGGDGRQWLVTERALRLSSPDAPRLTLVAVQQDFGFLGQRPGVVISLFVVPLLAILLASLALWIATNWMLLRWIDRLREAAARSGGGDHRLNVRKFNDAPDEIRSLASSMQKMARSMAQRSAGLKQALTQQRLMSLELHHRVKNNLQIVGSYLALHAGDRDGPGQLASAQLRVAALSLVHRLIYDKAELVDVEVPVLLTELGRLISSHQGLEPRSAIDIAIDKAASLARMDIDTATTTTLFLVEVADRLDDARALTFEARGRDQRLELTVCWEGAADPETLASSGLVAGFARQLGRPVTVLSEMRGLRICFAPQRLFRPALRDDVDA